MKYSLEWREYLVVWPSCIWMQKLCRECYDAKHFFLVPIELIVTWNLLDNSLKDQFDIILKK